MELEEQLEWQECCWLVLVALDQLMPTKARLARKGDQCNCVNRYIRFQGDL